jgi:hypothetical protein
MENLKLATWRSGHRVRLKNLRSQVQVADMYVCKKSGFYLFRYRLTIYIVIVIVSIEEKIHRWQARMDAKNELCANAGLPDGIFSKQTAHLNVFFSVLQYILCPFGQFYGHFV